MRVGAHRGCSSWAGPLCGAGPGRYGSGGRYGNGGRYGGGAGGRGRCGSGPGRGPYGCGRGGGWPYGGSGGDAWPGWGGGDRTRPRTRPPRHLGSRNSLAVVLTSLGEHRQAADLQRETLANYERALGPDHPSSLVSRNNLARAQARLDSAGRRRWWQPPRR
ncbi:tetratricopeptide repeat protein [Streptomyces cyaneofuscatus]|uniref:tetratricopeptide repeat protein n=1 Tax=Streptomyces cyaneofuscatus TaxID=66883 RepID=UPI003787E02C